jgi:putative hydrolase of the HAD superfamily
VTQFDTILFDLDHTLIDETPNVIAGYQAAGRYAATCYRIDPDQFADTAVVAARDAWWEPDWLGPLTDRYGLSAWDGLSEQFPGPHADLHQLRDWLPTYRSNTWRSTYSRCGVKAASYVIDETARTFTAARHRGRVRLARGIAHLIANLADRNLAIVTNGPADGQESKVHRAGLGSVVKAVVTSTAAGVGKPDPSLVTLCLSRLATVSRNVLIVGDSMERDIQLALNCGLPAIWIRSSPRVPIPDGVSAVTSPAKVAEAIHRLEAR